MQNAADRSTVWKRTMNGMMIQFLQQLNGQNFYYCERYTLLGSCLTTNLSFNPLFETLTTLTIRLRPRLLRGGGHVPQLVL
jgi:hypothetical protein